MGLKDYFENIKGTGILSTADAEGNVDCAIYARPHIMEDGTLALIMRDRLSHSNLRSNPKAAYLFMEEGSKNKGKRFFLRKVKEEQNTEQLKTLRRRLYTEDIIGDEPQFLVFFEIEKELPLVSPRGK